MADTSIANARILRDFPIYDPHTFVCQYERVPVVASTVTSGG